MSMMEKWFGLTAPRVLDAGIIVASLAVATAILLLSDWPGGIVVENGPVEMAQLAFLAIAAVLFLRASLAFGEWVALTTLALACLSLIAFVREIPRCTSPYYEFGPCIGADYKDAIYVLAGSLLLVLMVLNPRLRPSRFGRDAFSRLPGFLIKLWPLGLIVPLVVGSQLGDAFDRPVMEETLELCAYALLAFFALKAAQAGDRFREEDRMSAPSDAEQRWRGG